MSLIRPYKNKRQGAGAVSNGEAPVGEKRFEGDQAILPKMKQAAESTKERSRSNFQEFPAPQRISLVTLKV